VLIDVPLAGIRLSWRFPGAFGFFHSAESKVGSGQLMALCVQVGASPNDDLVNQVIRTVRNLNWSCVDIPWDHLSNGSPIESLGHQLGIHAVGSRVDFLRQFDIEIRGRGPLIATAKLDSQDVAEEVIENFSQLHSDLAKIRSADQSPLAFGVICFCPFHEKYQLDISRGLPVVSPDPLLSGPEPLAWQVYLHHRIAWEVAGQVKEAADLAALTSGIRVGDDDALEQILNDHSIDLLRSFNHSTHDCLKILKRWLRGQDAYLAPDYREFFTWRPQGTTRYLKPFIARAILTDNLCPVELDMRDGIRFATVCQPLIGSLFSATLEVEYRQRSKAAIHSLAELDPEIKVKARNLHRQFTENSSYIARLLYPRCSKLCPIHLDDWTSFLSYGQIVSRGNDTRTVNLRNALAHGHPASWRAITLLRECIDDFGFKE